MTACQVAAGRCHRRMDVPLCGTLLYARPRRLFGQSADAETLSESLYTYMETLYIMCGIAGLILSSGAPPPDPSVLSKLIGALHHRGPDGSGHAVMGRVALLHNRLAIIDLVTGDQPFFAGRARWWRTAKSIITANCASRCPASASPPTATASRRCISGCAMGSDYAKQLRGMYGIAIHERVRRTVTLSRDPFGIKPLYIATSRWRAGVRLGTAGAAGSRPGEARGTAGGGRGTAATPVHHRRRHHL